MVAVNPKVLVWARETAGLEQGEAARKIYSDSAKSSAVEKMVALERGERGLTQKQLFKLAKIYHQPLISFYLPDPPRFGEPLEDLRTVPDGGFDRKAEARLGLLIRDMKASQGIIRDLLEDEEGAEPLDFVGSASLDTGAERLARDIATRIGFELDEFRSQRALRDAFNYMRERVESAGIFALLQSDLGSYHTTIPVEVFRGFALADPIAPYIVINRQDAVAAWSFTALHETAHIWLGKSAVTGGYSQSEIERFCNQVAALILLPPDDLREIRLQDGATIDESAAAISDFADARNVSRAMVAYNLRLEGTIGGARWNELRRKFMQEWRDSRQNEKDERSGAGGPSFYAVRRSHLGPALIDLAANYVGTRRLTPAKASIALGVAARNVYRTLFPNMA